MKYQQGFRNNIYTNISMKVAGLLTVKFEQTKWHKPLHRNHNIYTFASHLQAQITNQRR